MNWTVESTVDRVGVKREVGGDHELVVVTVGVVVVFFS